MKDIKFIKYLPFYYVYATMLFLFGITGVCLGLYVIYVRGAMPGELILNKVLTLFSIGIVSSAVIHFKAFNTIRKLRANKENS
jgi:hypothetical protein